jgi:alkylation response protein AidB-like acyl-CoA dehydrogenase
MTTRLMDFQLTDEQVQLRDAVREFARAEIAPHVLDWDEAQTFPLDVVRKLADLGYLGCVFPSEYGGAGLDYVSYCVVVEELARVDPSVALIVAAHTSLCGGHIALVGTDEQKARYLSKIATGEWIGCWALTEPSSGSDAGSAQSTATKDGATWILNGTKTFCTNAHYAGLAVVMCVTDRAKLPHGMSAFLVETSTPGFRLGRKENKLGMRASATGEIVLEDCRVPDSCLLGRAGEAFIDTLRLLDSGRISIAALSVGLAQGAYEAALRYAKERKQFGKPISGFQAIQLKLADMATSIDAARLLTYRAASLYGSGRAMTKTSSMAKLFASETAATVATEALQIHGGYGFIKDYGVEKFYRDVRLCTVGEGTSEIQRLVIAREILNG